MPAGPRVRANNVYGTVSDNPLLIAAVSFTSLGLSLLPAISGQHAVIVLDPKRVFGEPEIVVVTSHLAMGTTATITRAQYGTVARQHPQGTAWAHVPVDEDWTEILTSGTRPGNPYSGQLIFETDTDRFVARDNANSNWVRTNWLTATARTGFQASRITNQSINNVTETLVTWPIEDFDSDAFFTAGGSTGTVPAGLNGLYSISFRISLSAVAATRGFVGLQVAATPVGRIIVTGDDLFRGTWIYPLVAGQTVGITLFQQSGGALNVTSGLFEVFRLGA